MIKEILQKLAGRKRRDDYEPERLSPDEVELNSYMERERKDKVRRMLDYYRKKKEYEYWHSKRILQGKKGQVYSRSIILKEGRII